MLLFIDVASFVHLEFYPSLYNYVSLVILWLKSRCFSFCSQTPADPRSGVSTPRVPTLGARQSEQDAVRSPGKRERRN